MAEKTKKNKEYKRIQISYTGRDCSFFKTGEDLRFEDCGKPLADFTFFNLTELQGLFFNKKSSIGQAIYVMIVDQELEEEEEEEKDEEDWFFSFKEKKKIEEISILDSDIFLIVYTQCQIDNVVLFFVWHFETHMVTESREAWEARYGLVPGACCLKNSVTFSSLESRQGLEGNPNQEALADRKNKKCQFKNEYVACHATVFPHFVNPENPKAVEFLKNHPLNIPVNMDMTFGPLKDTPAFCYGGHKLGLCNSLYDSIIYDDTYQGKGEHNLEKFFSDAIATCFLYQNAIKPINYKPKNMKHSVIGVSLYY